MPIPLASPSFRRFHVASLVRRRDKERRALACAFAVMQEGSPLTAQAELASSPPPRGGGGGGGFSFGALAVGSGASPLPTPLPLSQPPLLLPRSEPHRRGSASGGSDGASAAAALLSDLPPMSLGAWVAVVKAAKPRTEEWEAEALFAVLDCNSDGLITAEEFLSLPEVLSLSPDPPPPLRDPLALPFYPGTLRTPAQPAN